MKDGSRRSLKRLVSAPALRAAFARRCAGAWVPALILLAACLSAAAAPTDPGPLAEPRVEAVPAAAVPRGVVATLAQDGAGFLWLATGDGLMRFDGYRLRPVEREHADPQRRSLGWIRALLPGRDGRLWIGSESDGLVVYEPDADRVRVLGAAVAVPGGAAAVAAQPVIRALAEDAGGSIWIGTLGAGLQRYSPASGRFEVYRAGAAPGALPEDRVYALQVDADDTLWVGLGAGKSSGLWRRARGSERFEPVPGALPPGRTVQALHAGAGGRLWIGTEAGDVARFDPASGRTVLLPPAPGPQGAVTSFAETPDGMLWVGRMTGIELRDARDGRVLRTLRHDPRRRGGLEADEVTTLLRDRAGTLWIAGFGLGLQRHRPDAAALQVRGADLDLASPFVQPSARALLVDRERRVWVAVPGRGLAVFDERLRFLRAPSLVRRDGRPLLVVDALAETADGHLWLAAGDELHELDGARRPRRVLPHVGLTHRLVAGRDGTLWICAQAGLFRLAPGAGAPERVPMQHGAALPGEAFVAVEDDAGTLWVGTSGGLFRVPARAAARLEPVPVQPGAALGNPVVIGLLFDGRGSLWVDTAVSGLHRARLPARAPMDGPRTAASLGAAPASAPSAHEADASAPLAFERVSADLGFVGRPFGANLMADERGRIWTQLHVHDPVAGRIDALTPADGADIGTGWFHSHARLPDGRLLFGGSRGILVVTPALWQPSAAAPPVVLTELRIDGVAQPAGPFVKSVALERGQRTLAVEFAALDFDDPGRQRYAWMLEGFDTYWLPASSDRRIASYGNLDPGQYRLRVRAVNRSGLPSPHELTLAVEVQPAWWQTLPARLLGFALVMLAAAGALQWRTHALRSRQAVLERRVRERTAELERLSAALRESSLTDPLTGLRNRRTVAEQLGEDFALLARRRSAARRGTAPHPLHEPDGARERLQDPEAPDEGIAVYLVDIDHFKRINDLHGHGSGDRVLVAVAQRLKAACRASDLLVRWGGEEFLIVARDTPRARAAEFAERLRRLVADTPVPLDGGTALVCTVSIGFVCHPLATAPAGAAAAADAADTLQPLEVVDLADAALYAAKRGGRNRWLGVVGRGRLEMATLRARGPVSGWLATDDLETVRSWPADDPAAS